MITLIFLGVVIAVLLLEIGFLNSELKDLERTTLDAELMKLKKKGRKK